ncbi:MAG TPA: DUF3566 domain-containing protein, partial [Acidimicrobiia bacterium]|nr:DUF3566 domain-containing protein [Acidimicrobiia bacterium]
ASLDAGSVFRLSLGLYLAVFAVVLGAGILFWFLLSAVGVVGQIEGFLGELLGYEDYQFLGWRILQYFVLLGLLWVTVAAAVTALLTILYNRVSKVVGGIQVSLEEE